MDDMKTVALIKNNVIDNVIVWDGVADLSILNEHYDELYVLEPNSEIGIGWIRVDNIWSRSQDDTIGQ